MQPNLEDYSLRLASEEELVENDMVDRDEDPHTTIYMVLHRQSVTNCFITQIPGALFMVLWGQEEYCSSFLIDALVWLSAKYEMENQVQ